jgi:hypothetical protein
MPYSVEYWEDCNEASPPYQFYQGLDERDQVKFDKLGPDLLEEHGINKMLQTRYLEKFKGIEEDIYELKVTCKNKTQLRAFICEFNVLIYILEMFWKKTQKKIPKKHINNAINRYKKL